MPNPAAAKTDAVGLVQSALQLHQARQFKEAETLYRRALAIDARQPDALQLLGSLFLQHGDHLLAIEYLKRAIAVRPEVAAYHSNCGEACRAAGQLKEATACYEKAIALDPALFEPRVALGITERRLGNFVKSEAAARAAIEISSGRHEAHLVLGQALRGQQRDQEAIAEYRTAVSLSVDKIGTMLDAAEVIGEIGEADEALALLEKVDACDPGNVRTFSIILDIYPRSEVLAKAAFLRAAHNIPAKQTETRLYVAKVLRTMFGDGYEGAKVALVDVANNAIGPFRIRLESASACNLRCQHCPTGVNYDATDRTAMKMELFEKILDQMKRMPTLRECVLYLGGEPLMNKHLVEMCKRVKNETSVTGTFITTNAMLLTEAKCAGLADAMLDQILVSVDGHSPEENDAIRVRADYKTIVENVAMLRRHLKSANVATQVVISHAMIRRQDDPDVAVTPEFLKRDFPGINIWSDYATRWPGFDIDKTSLDSELTPAGGRNFCDFPFFELAVRANGEVVLCCHDLLGESVMGNIHETELADIWNGPGYRELRRHMLNRDANGVHAVCKKCFVFTGEHIVRTESFLPSSPQPIIWASE